MSQASEPPLLYVNQTFSSYNQFQECLKLYQNKTCSIYTTKTSKTIENVNKKGGAFKPELKYYNLALCCKRGGLKRIRAGKGIRDIQGTWKVDCPSKIVLTATADGFLKVTALHETHENHDTSEEEFNLLPEVRKQAFAECQEELDVLFRANVKPAKMRFVLRELCSGHINPRDLMNLRAKWKNVQHGGRSEVQRLIDALCGIMEADPGAFIYIVKNDDGELVNLFIQTSAMRQNAIEFGSVLIMDHTYLVNKNRMATCLTMGMDGNGEGRITSLAYLSNERRENVSNTLAAYKRIIGQEAAEQVKTVLIDKDMSEAAAVRDHLPNANIQLCDFHVSNTFKLRTAHESAELRALLTKIRFAHDDNEFNKLKEQIQAAASETFWAYFEKNWLHCSMAWSFRDKKKSVNLGNTTTGRLENFNGKVKKVLNVDNTVAESVEGILGLVTNKEEDSSYKSRIEATKEYYSISTNDPTVHAILNELTKFAATKYIEELKAEVSESQLEHFKASVTDCTCAHYCSYVMPCRHMLQMRRVVGAVLYDLNEIKNPIWKKRGDPQAARVPPFRAAVRCDAKVQPKTTAEKYNRALSLSKQLCSILSEKGAEQYARGYALLKDLYKLMAENANAVIFKLVNEESAVSLDGKITVALPSASNSTLVHNGSEERPETSALSFVAPGVADNAVTTAECAQNIQIITSSSQTQDILVDSNGLTDPRCAGNVKIVTPSNLVQNDLLTTAILSESHCKESLTFSRAETLQNVPHVKSGVLNLFMGQAAEDGGSLAGTAKDIRTADALPQLSCTSGSSSGLNNDPPLCFCGIPAIRLHASQTSRMAGRPFWKCSQTASNSTGCKFWRIAKKENHKNLEGTFQSFDDSARLLTTSVNNNHMALSNKNQDLSLENEDDNAALNELVEIMEADLFDNDLLVLNVANTPQGCVDLLVQDNVDSNLNTSDVDGKFHTETDPVASKFRDSLSDLKLPVSVKSRGRPKDYGKTVLGTLQKGNKRSGGENVGAHKRSRLMLKKSNNYEAESRHARALEIADGDVVFNGTGWTIRSQNKKTGGETYQVVKKETYLPCHCETSDTCAHKFTCTCPDRVRPCKHTYKVSMIASRSNLKGVCGISLFLQKWGYTFVGNVLQPLFSMLGVPHNGMRLGNYLRFPLLNTETPAQGFKYYLFYYQFLFTLPILTNQLP